MNVERPSHRAAAPRSMPTIHVESMGFGSAWHPGRTLVRQRLPSTGYASFSTKASS